jgi:phage tail sheath protein FI
LNSSICKPAGLTEGVVICDETNNTADIIDTNQLIVDIIPSTTRTAEFITLRTTVQKLVIQLLFQAQQIPRIMNHGRFNNQTNCFS